MVGNKAFKIKGAHVLRKVKTLTSDPRTDRRGKEAPLSKMETLLMMKGVAQHPWSHRTEQGRGQEGGLQDARQRLNSPAVLREGGRKKAENRQKG